MKYLLAFGALLLLMLTACGEDKKTSTSLNQEDDKRIRYMLVSSSIKPVFESDVEEFKLRGTHARLIRTTQGTRIHVPSEAFVSKATGDPIEGDVVLTFNEFHSQAEILASGIPMNYINPEGDTVDFESAGVYDIRAFQDGMELELAKDKEIEVELAGDTDGTFEFYAFNEVDENWELKETESTPIPNPYIPKQKMELEKLEAETPQTPKELIEYVSGDPLFDIKHYGTNEQELDALDGVFWKFTGDSTQIDPSEDNAAFNKEYDFVELKLVDSSEVREYDLIFRDEEGEIVVRAAPIFQGKLLTRETKRMERILNQIEYAMRSKSQIEEYLAEEKRFMRMMKIDRMGIYNFGRTMNADDMIHLIAEFTLDGEAANEDLSVYLLPKEKNCVLKFTPDSFHQFRINPSETNRILAISQKEKNVYFLSFESIQELNISKSNAGSKQVFDLIKPEEQIQTIAQLEELISPQLVD